MTPIETVQALVDAAKKILPGAESQMNDDRGQRHVEVSKKDIRALRKAVDAVSPALLPRSPQAVQEPASVRMLTEDDMTALQRIAETFEDGQGWDIDAMRDWLLRTTSP